MNTPVSDSFPEHWNMYFDGSLNINGVGVGVYFISPSGDMLSYVLRIHFKASNNAAKYEIALHDLRIAIELDIKRLMVFGDSALVINQVNKDWDCTSERMDAYCAQIRKLVNKFYGLEFHHVVWANNEAVDKLLKLGSTRVVTPMEFLFMTLLCCPSRKKGSLWLKVCRPASRCDFDHRHQLKRAIHQVSHLYRGSLGQD
jgi:ribonuclease HI